MKNFDKKVEDIKENLKEIGFEVNTNVKNSMKPKYLFVLI